MKLTELKNALTKNPAAVLRFVLPDGMVVPAHAHVTEVARVDKRFIDCGGTLRNDAVCRLQVWVAGDTDHRLAAEKLGKILEKAGPILGTDDLDVDVEYEAGLISQFPVDSIEAAPNELRLRLTSRHTDCLAKDKCGPTPQYRDFNPMKFDFREPLASVGCCEGKSACN